MNYCKMNSDRTAEDRVQQALKQVTSSPHQLQYIEFVGLLELVGLIRRNYQEQLDEQTILMVQALWNNAGGTTNLYIKLPEAVRVVTSKLLASQPDKQIKEPDAPPISARSNNRKLTLKSPSTTSFLMHTDSNKENICSNSVGINQYIAKRVQKIRQDFAKTTQRTPLSTVWLTQRNAFWVTADNASLLIRTSWLRFGRGILRVIAALYAGRQTLHWVGGRTVEHLCMVDVVLSGSFCSPCSYLMHSLLQVLILQSSLHEPPVTCWARRYRSPSCRRAFPAALQCRSRCKICSKPCLSDYR